jgi:hypothetical protein
VRRRPLSETANEQVLDKAMSEVLDIVAGM